MNPEKSKEQDKQQTSTGVDSDNLLAFFKRITHFVFDVDGVLTDGMVLLLPEGLQARRMNIKDGLALQMALKNNYTVLIISGGYSEPVMDRLRYLGLTQIHLGIQDKAAFLKNFCVTHNIPWQSVLFMGDDLPDAALIQKAGLGCCPADAVPEVKSASRYISRFKGGEGCVRDVIEKVLKLNDHWVYDTEVSSR